MGWDENTRLYMKAHVPSEEEEQWAKHMQRIWETEKAFVHEVGGARAKRRGGAMGEAHAANMARAQCGSGALATTMAKSEAHCNWVLWEYRRRKTRR